MLNKLGEVPYGYQAPTGYPDTAEDWVNTGALLERLNFAVAVASNRIPGTFVNLKLFDSEDKAHVLDRAVAAILDGEISPATKATLAKQIERPLPEVKSGSELTEQEMDIPNIREGQQGRRSQDQDGDRTTPERRRFRQGGPDDLAALRRCDSSSR